MITIGLDDTDTLDSPGTNQLAHHLVRELAAELTGRIILRHQLLEDPRVPCTRKNGCASIQFETRTAIEIPALAARLRALILGWIPNGSDPGLAIAESIPPAIAGWGRRAKRELLTQAEALQLAAANGIYLEGLAGTKEGIIGALAALGLISTQNDGRVVYLASIYATTDAADALDVTGPLSVAAIESRGIQAVIDYNSNERITAGTIEVGKMLRPNLRDARVVLYATRRAVDLFEAIRVT